MRVKWSWSDDVVAPGAAAGLAAAVAAAGRGDGR
jgi:hypothetical protein